MMRSELSVSLVTMLALSSGASLQEEFQRLVDEAVASGEQGGCSSASTGTASASSTLQMKTSR